MRRCKTRPIEILHGVPHIAQQAFELRRAECGHRLGDLEQPRIPHSQNFTYCHGYEYLSGLFSVSLRRAMSGLVYIKTFGCQMNEYDSSKMQDVLGEAHGMTRTDDPAQADVLLVNTCSVREKAQEKVFSLLGEWRAFKELRPHVVIGVGGCVASQEGEGITARAPYVDLVFGPQTLHRLPELIEGLKRTGRPQIDVSFPEIEKFDRLPEARAHGATAYVSIMEGCSKYCTFCVVPYTRGEEISRPFEQVLGEVETLAAQGVREVTLLGQNVNAYAGGMEDGSVADLATLIHFVAAVPGVERIRFTTSHPLEFNDSLIEAYASVPKLNNLLHLPVQSGSDRVLAAMKRGHTALEYKQKLRKLRAVRPGISITTDIIVGFPGRDRRGLFGHHEPDRGCGLRSILQLHLQPPSRHARCVLPGRGALRREAAEARDRTATFERPIPRHFRSAWSAAGSGCWSNDPPNATGASSPGRTDNNRWVNFDGPARAHQSIHRRDHHRGAAQFLAGTAGERNRRHGKPRVNSVPTPRDVVLAPLDNVRLVELCGPLDEHLHQIEARLGVDIRRRGNRFQIVGPPAAAKRAEAVLQDLYARAQREPVDSERVHIALQELDMNGGDPAAEPAQRPAERGPPSITASRQMRSRCAPRAARCAREARIRPSI